jgi:hypothetical protein
MPVSGAGNKRHFSTTSQPQSKTQESVVLSDKHRATERQALCRWYAGCVRDYRGLNRSTTLLAFVDTVVTITCSASCSPVRLVVTRGIRDSFVLVIQFRTARRQSAGGGVAWCSCGLTAAPGGLRRWWRTSATTSGLRSRGVVSVWPRRQGCVTNR